MLTKCFFEGEKVSFLSFYKNVIKNIVFFLVEIKKRTTFAPVNKMKDATLVVD